MSDPTVPFLRLDDVEPSRAADGVGYREFLRVLSMSAGQGAQACRNAGPGSAGGTILVFFAPAESP